ncbi:MAG: hypothetical protein HKO66_01560, partial [Saprospiraceae bacterium]|nr:hypothetical protein [Saprospiraceae bacterium]
MYHLIKSIKIDIYLDYWFIPLRIFGKLSIVFICICIYANVYSQPLCSGLSNMEIGGYIFEDWNYNGSKDVNENIGVPGVVVNITSCDGVSTWSTVSDSDGNWTVNVGATPFCNGADDLRVEFIIPSNLDTWAEITSSGSNNGTSVQFLSKGSCSYLAISATQDYCQDSSRVSVICYEGGTGVGNINPALVSFGYNATGLPAAYGGTGENPVPEAQILELGAVAGMGYQVDKKRLFIGSFLKRFVGLINGPGNVYIMNYSGGTPVIEGDFDLQGINPANGGPSLDFGIVCRDAGCAFDPGNTGIPADYILPESPYDDSWDLDAFGKIGKMAMGDLELSEDNNTLFLVNLFQNAIVTIDVSGNTSSLPGEVNQYLIGSLPGAPTCISGSIRPFALSIRRGVGYLGLICDASVSQLPSDLEAYVLSFDPENISAGFSTVVNFDLDYVREFGQNPAPPINWKAWADTWATLNPQTNGSDNNYMAAQPILSDIEFSENGSLVLGFMDRFGHQNGRANHRAISQDPDLVDTNSGGDIIQVCNVAGTYTVEGGV